ncbi:SH3 domain-containing protein [Jiella sp. M17.18]|uniref:SH3 domain-containing protein n=1 Tax=Jiella sp. M17.18 TaxID=3234247 RepID=UPI0034DE4CA6
MTTGDPSTRRDDTDGAGRLGIDDAGRLSTEEIRRRLIARHEAHRQAEAEASMRRRLMRWQEDRKKPVPRLFVPQQRAGRFAVFRRRPVLSYLGAACASAVLVAGLTVFVSTGSRDQATLVASRAAPSPTGPAKAVAAGPARGAEAAAPAVSRPTPAPAETAGIPGDGRAPSAAGSAEPGTVGSGMGARLRSAANTLPQVAAQPKIDPVAAALALRLPVNPETTGSLKAAPAPPVDPAPLAASPAPAATLSLPAADGGGGITVPAAVLARPALPPVAAAPAEAPVGSLAASTVPAIQPPLAAAQVVVPGVPAAVLSPAAAPDIIEVSPPRSASVSGNAAAPAQAEAAQAPSASAQATPDAPTAVAAAAPARTGVITATVHMRKGPDNSSDVVAILPKGGTVAVISCTDWCEVESDGKRGFVFNKFVDERAKS